MELGTKTTERFESSYTVLAKYAMENVRIVNIFTIIIIIIIIIITTITLVQVDTPHIALSLG